LPAFAAFGNFAGNSWQPLATEIPPPFRVVPFENKASGTVSFRVTGSWSGGRTRKNFGDRASADAFCNAKNAEALQAMATAPRHLVQTRLGEADVHAAEVGVDRIAGRWPLGRVIDAGIAALEAAKTAEPVGALVEDWLVVVEGEVSQRWYSDLRDRVRRFAADHPKLTTTGWDRAVTRAWLDALKTVDGQPMSKTSKANMRNAVHRFAAWLVERGKLDGNPAAGIRITGRTSGAKIADRPLPAVFTPRQAEALLWACQTGACRRLLGWMATCLFTGMRPDSEAPRATWDEVDLGAAEWNVMGRKRGARPRIIPLQPTAVAWLRVVKADKMEKPALYSRRAKVRAIELANEWLREHHPNEPAIAWDEDITRHTYASHRAPMVSVADLAEEMGTSPKAIYGFYRNPRRAAAVAAFWALRPSGGVQLKHG
jgi:integrase